MSQTLTGARIEHVIGAGGRLHLRLADGQARIRGVDGDRVVVVEHNGRDLAQEFVVELEADSFTLRTKDRLFGLSLGGRRPPELDVEVPASAVVVIETVSGEISGEGLRGEQRYRTASGSLSLTGISGDVTVDAVSADTHLEALGDVVLNARTVSGDLDLAAPRILGAAVATTSGRIGLSGELTAGGSYSVQTVSGDVFVTTDTGLAVEARTVTGGIRTERAQRSDGGPGRRRVVIGDGSAQLSFRSISGDLRIAGPADARQRTPSKGDPADPVERATPPTDDEEARRLAILRALEQGDIDVDEAANRLAELEEVDHG
jgi:hypothetical protein